MYRLILGAPFGNYLNFPNCTSTLGTFTPKCRGSWCKRLDRVLLTLRYYPGIQAWKNELGLPNPGIGYLKNEYLPDHIISIMGFANKEWIFCAQSALDCLPLAVEWNVSCPNCPGEDQTNYSTVFKEVISELGNADRFIVKLPPLNYENLYQAALNAGITRFHCCNTLAIPGGGLSGKPLKPLSLNCIEHIINSEITQLIGGGGITHPQDVKDYLNAGCTHVSVASVLFNPFSWSRIKKMAKESVQWTQKKRLDTRSR